MMFAILLNGIVIFLLYFPDYAHNQWLIEIDHFFIIIFLIEAIVKLIHLKPKKYFADGWNVFDFLIVVVSLPALLSSFIPMPQTSILKILRLLRLIRLARFVKFIPRMTMILAGLGRAIKASVFVMMALMFLNFMLALFTCHFYSQIAPEYFGDPLISSYTIFQMFTVEGWNEIPATIAERINEQNFGDYEDYYAGATRFYFVLVVLAGGIFGMSLANAIFVDEMTMDNNQDLETKIDGLQTQISELKALLEKKD